MNNIQVGKKISSLIVFSQEDVNKFAKLSGDNNPIHIDLDFASKSRFGKTICHGMLVYAAISEYLSKEFPKTKTLSETLFFFSPIYVNEEVSLVQEIIGVMEKEEKIEIKSTVSKADGTTACQSSVILKISQ
jgi:acyl dehydratase